METAKKILNKRWILVLIFLVIYAAISYISYRGLYLETLEIGEEYLTVFKQNMKYQYGSMLVIFLIVYFSIYITNIFIKRGLSQFFKEEKKEMPKLPNKSIAFILAILVSIIFSKSIVEKLMLAMNATNFGEFDLLFNLDMRFFIFQKGFIELIIEYGIRLIIGLAIYTTAYYVISFNVFFEAVSGETLKKNTFIKQLIFFVRIITLLAFALILIKVQGMQTDEFLNLADAQKTSICGAGLTDITVKLWGYRILAFVMVASVFVAIEYFKKEKSMKVIISLCVIPAYLVVLFIVMTAFQLLFVRNNELDKQKVYIQENINKTKQGYNIQIDEVDIKSTGTITTDEVDNNKNVIKNIPIINSDITLSTLNSLQTSTGYYSYQKTRPTMYNISNENKLIYISPREILSSGRTYNNKTYEYTHGYGVILSSASEVDENGNIKVIQKEFNGTDSEISIKQPRIYFGQNTDDIIVTNTSNKKEFDYPISSTQSAETAYTGNAGLKLNFFDRLVIALKEKDIKLAFSNKVTSESKILANRNILQRAKTIMPYLIYDNEPYMVVTDSGELVWVIDAYTVSNEYPYSQPTTIEYDNTKKQINYIRNSAKVLVDAYNGTTNFYITDKSDPIIMAYNNIYDNLFKDESEIPQDISKHFVYPKFLYDVQSKVLEMYHNVSTDVLYRGDDVWDIVSDPNAKGSDLKSYYTTVKTANSLESKVGLMQLYTPRDKKNINAYLIGTLEDKSPKLKLYKFSSDSNVLGTVQLVSQIEEDETISKEISSITITGTKLIKDIVIVPINNTLLYVEPIYQISLNEKNSVPVLKKVIVASGNKVAIGNTLQDALKILLSESAVNVELEDTDTIEGLLQKIIKANNNLTESNKTSNWEQIGRDLGKLQELINLLEKLKTDTDSKNVKTNEVQNIISSNIIVNENLILQE